MKRARYSSPEGGWWTKRRLTIVAVFAVLLLIIAILATVLLMTAVSDEKLIDASSQQRSCGGSPCVHGSCRCTKTEKICVCYGNYTGKSCDVLKQAGCNGNEKCLREKGPPVTDNGWFSPGVEYQYLLTKSRKSWSEARRICQKYGGDLAALGIRNRATRIATVLQLNRGKITWIGLKREGGKWSWINGDRPYNAYWLPDQPNQKPTSNCGVIDDYENDYSTENFECNRRFHALCEKRVS